MPEVMIIEDNLVACELIAEVIEETGFYKGKTFHSAEDALESLKLGYTPQIILLDIHLPGIDGISAIPLIKAICPSTEIIIQTVFEEPEIIMSAIRAGISGYILKGTKRNELRWALQNVTEGGSPLSPIVARTVLRAFSTNHTKQLETTSTVSTKMKILTLREQEILDKLIQGYSYRDIGFELNISPNTVNSHLRSVYEKLRVNTRAEAVALATGHM